MTKSTVEIAREEGRGQRAEHKARAFDVVTVRRDFPILQNDKLVYLDNAATSQKPRQVIERLQKYYETENANIHRGVYQLSQTATQEYEQARKKVARLINAPHDIECIFTRGTTEAINLVAHSFARAFLKAGDEIIISNLEHHSNIVPWQIVCEMTGAVLKVIPINDAGELLLDEYAKLLSERTKLVSVCHVSNSLGTVNDVKRITQMAHNVGARVMIDGAQAAPHLRVDVQDIGCDFYAISGHKMFGPTGIGVLWGRRELLEKMPPYQAGGDMIETVTLEKTTYAQLPNKFEAGTPHIGGAIGLGAAVDYLESLGGVESLAAHEHDLLQYATTQLSQINGVRIIGTAKSKASVISFVIDDPPISSLDVGMELDREGVAVRTGHHCCQPVMDRLCIPSTARMSLAFYNTRQDVQMLVHALRNILQRHQARAVLKPASAAPAQAAEIKFPAASGASPSAVADEIAGVFDFLEERNAKNEQVIDYAKDLPSYFDVLKNLTQRVPGCMSQVYIIGRRVPGSSDRFEFVADADADIVRGEIAILEKLYSGQRAKDVLDFDIEAFFNRIGLEHFLTAQRRNGLASMVKRIRTDAAAIVNSGASS
jgi:cysteine desulfurase/selenocysteine lyase